MKYPLQARFRPTGKLVWSDGTVNSTRSSCLLRVVFVVPSMCGSYVRFVWSSSSPVLTVLHSLFMQSPSLPIRRFLRTAVEGIKGCAVSGVRMKVCVKANPSVCTGRHISLYGSPGFQMSRRMA